MSDKFKGITMAEMWDELQSRLTPESWNKVIGKRRSGMSLIVHSLDVIVREAMNGEHWEWIGELKCGCIFWIEDDSDRIIRDRCSLHNGFSSTPREQVRAFLEGIQNE